MADTSRPDRSMPVVESAISSYRSVFENLPALLRISWAWLAIMTVLFLLFLRKYSGFSADKGFEGIGTGILIGFLAFIAVMLGLASIAVAWHRVLLLKEQSDAPFNLRLDGPVWSYLGYTILLGFIMVVLAIPAGIVLSPLFAILPLPNLNGDNVSILHLLLVGLIGILALLPGWYVATRLSLVLPAVAVGKPLGLGGAMEATSGNGWALFWASLLIALPAWLIQLVLGTIAGGGIGEIITELIGAAVSVLSMIAGVSLLSEAYRRLVGTASI